MTAVMISKITYTYYIPDCERLVVSHLPVIFQGFPVFFFYLNSFNSLSRAFSNFFFFHCRVERNLIFDVEKVNIYSYFELWWTVKLLPNSQRGVRKMSIDGHRYDEYVRVFPCIRFDPFVRPSMFSRRNNSLWFSGFH